ncbi:chalcone isomerase family protein [Ulvibacter litoralis]|uniref:Chalcone isomerase-like n=1 Tax=Ulvibacter litoralis TaxID=227084 RepID=A0A1G7F510_9FLAO|nr:chalcone isomerase family protein [Ulvibacter litoralis]GHC52653.1 chalcone isomerase [Ulvibacter litoralis]SDE70957.1 Chalcone isomerase-like [Ulvibacter litoralis]
MKNLFVLVIAMVTMNMAVAQTEVGSVTLPNTVNFGGQDLLLNGAGIRKKAMVLKLYSGGLYLGKKSSDAKSIVSGDETMAIKLVITSSFVSSEAMSEAVLEGFNASTGGDMSMIASEIKKFISFFEAEIVENDTFDITYQKGKGVVSYKNGKELGTIAGMNFKKALFGIWLGNDPADSKLKKAMLGK